ncbi:general secretion pathway protein GspB [Thalassotalea psychrophila]|uniref:General secretion pathway protein GspB n=1 Tax=Thalassotalea psychrophila TaxID=3065647 RepID=A0ABY9TX80_9GAMM|nr:general secretion pathway protein GspB [Colwelliaceae bacterium SQ149]
MSYLLDALKKATSVNSTEPKLNNDDLHKQLTSSDSEQPSGKNLPKALASYALLAFAFAIGGFVLGDGAEIIVNYQNDSNVNKIETAKPIPDETLIPFYGATHDSAKYFATPNEYNQQLISLKTAQAEQLKKEILAQQKADEKAKKQLMEQQIQSLLSQQNIQQAIVANKATKTPTEKVSSTNANGPVKLSLNRDELGDVSPELLKAFENAIDDTNNSSVNDVVEEPEIDLSKHFAEPEIEVDLRNRQLIPAKPLAQMPQWLQNEVPSLHFSLHMYTSEVASSWVRLNGQDYYTGGMTKDGVIIEEIQPQTVILQFQGQRFSLKALSSW